MFTASDKTAITVEITTPVEVKDDTTKSGYRTEYVFPTLSICHTDCSYEIGTTAETPNATAASYTPGTNTVTITIDNKDTAVTGAPSTSDIFVDFAGASCTVTNVSAS